MGYMTMRAASVHEAAPARNYFEPTTGPQITCCCLCSTGGYRGKLLVTRDMDKTLDAGALLQHAFENSGVYT